MSHFLTRFDLFVKSIMHSCVRMSKGNIFLNYTFCPGKAVEDSWEEYSQQRNDGQWQRDSSPALNHVNNQNQKIYFCYKPNFQKYDSVYFGDFVITMVTSGE